VVFERSRARQAGEGAVTSSSLPRRYNKRWLPSADEVAGAASRLRGRTLQFQAELAQVVTSAVRFVFAPDVQFDELDFSEKAPPPIPPADLHPPACMRRRAGHPRTNGSHGTAGCRKWLKGRARVQVLVPIIVFRDHLMSDPLDAPPGGRATVDVKEIEEQLRRIALPGQEIEVVAGLQVLSLSLTHARAHAHTNAHILLLPSLSLSHAHGHTRTHAHTQT